MKSKLLSVVLAFLMAVSTASLAACGGNGGNNVADDENTLEIRVVSLGYGHKWATELEKKFEAANPGVDVVIKDTTDQDMDRSVLLSGPKANHADIMFGTVTYLQEIVKGNRSVPGYDFALEDLTDFVNETVYPDGTTLRERFLPGYLEPLYQQVEINGEYKSRLFDLSYATGIMGIVYNIGLFETYGWKEPRTTDELWALCDDITSKGYIAISNTPASTYLNYFSDTVFAQYLGLEEYLSYWNPTSEDDFYKYTNSPENYARLYALEEMNKLENPSFGRLTKFASQDSYDKAQARIITDEAVLAVNGDWFVNEMRIITSQAQANGRYLKGTGFMQFPVTSTLSDKLSYWSKIFDSIAPTYYDAEQRVENLEPNFRAADELLAKLVDYVDNGKTGAIPSINFNGNVIVASEEDVNIVEAARKVSVTNGCGCSAVIPAYASAKELAKKFLAYMYSDEGADIVAANMAGALLPIKTDVTKFSNWSSMNVFNKKVAEYSQTFKNATYTTNIFDFKIKKLPSPTNSLQFYLYKFDDPKYVSPYQIFNRDSITREQFIQKMYDAGLI